MKCVVCYMQHSSYKQDAASLLDMQGQLDMELYTFLCWPVVSKTSRSVNRDSW